MTDRDATHLSHIARSIAAIDQYLVGVTEESFLTSPMVRDAVLRNLEIISEASRRLSDELKARYVSVPWRVIAAAGNFYRHEYDKVNEAVIWQTATASLEPIRTLLCDELGERP